MSDLHCPARFVVLSTDAEEAQVHAATADLPLRAVQAATTGPVATSLAERAGVQVGIDPRLAEGGEHFRETLESLADLHRGETVAVVCPPEIFGAVGALVAAGSDGRTLMIDVDADGWVLVAR